MHSLKSHQALLNVQIRTSVFLILSAFSVNTLKVFYHCQRIRQKYLIILGECTYQALSVHGDYGGFIVVLLIQSRLRIRQKYYCVHGELY
jgi:hypothetical protein